MPNYDDLAQALASEGAAFGVFPQMSGKRKTQDVEAAKNIPVDILRGRVAGLLGAIPDLLNMAGRSPMPTETFGDTQYEPTKQLPYGSEHYLKTLPLAPTTQTGRVANEMGALVPLDPRTVVKAGKPVVSLLGNELARGMYGNEGSLANVIPTAMKPKMLDVYHGTPHSFERFDASKIGTGEGAQAYGHGIYVAESPEVARGYANKLGANLVMVDGKPMDFNDPIHIAASIISDPNNAGLPGKQLASAIRYDPKGIVPFGAESKAEEIAKVLESGNIPKFTNEKGNFYKADLPDEMIPKMLDWDKPMTEEQMISIYDKMQQSPLASFAKPFQDNFYERMNRGQPTTDGQDLFIELSKELGGQKQVSDYLRSIGIPGIKYLDEGSRGATGQGRWKVTFKDGKEKIMDLKPNDEVLQSIGATAEPHGTRNFVVFPGEEQNIKILERNAEKTTK